MADAARLIGQTKVEVATASHLAWSPDGTRIAVSGNGGMSVVTIGGPVVSLGRFASTLEEARRKNRERFEQSGAAFASLRDHDALREFYASGRYRPDRSSPREQTTRVTEGWYLASGRRVSTSMAQRARLGSRVKMKTPRGGGVALRDSGAPCTRHPQPSRSRGAAG